MGRHRRTNDAQIAKENKCSQMKRRLCWEINGTSNSVVNWTYFKHNVICAEINQKKMFSSLKEKKLRENGRFGEKLPRMGKSRLFFLPIIGSFANLPPFDTRFATHDAPASFRFSYFRLIFASSIVVPIDLYVFALHFLLSSSSEEKKNEATAGNGKKL